MSLDLSTIAFTPTARALFRRRRVRVSGVEYYGHIRPDLQYLLREVRAGQAGHFFIRYDEVEFRGGFGEQAECGNAACQGRNFVANFLQYLPDKIEKKFFVIDYQNARVVSLRRW